LTVRVRILPVILPSRFVKVPIVVAMGENS
jgi:hypothetical protein